jgi:hypothetical protein
VENIPDVMFINFENQKKKKNLASSIINGRNCAMMDILKSMAFEKSLRIEIGEEDCLCNEGFNKK